MRISAITPTADRPAGFALCEQFMRRQTRAPDEWIVADGGAQPAACSSGQIHVHDPWPAGAVNFARNLLNGLERASGDVIVFIEDDDWYSPEHIATLAAALENPGAMLAGSDRQNYYNLPARCWRSFANVGASLCQTGMKREAAELMHDVILTCMGRRSYGIDTTLWRAVPRAQWAITEGFTTLGIKGLPGQAGLGIGHRPAGKEWLPDNDFAKLRAWIGADAAIYERYSP